MNARHVAALASGLALSFPVAADPPRSLEPADQTILNIRLSVAVLATYGELGGKLPEPYPKLARLDSLGSALGADLRRKLEARDGWGHALEILVLDPKRFSLISFGADGKPDRPYEKIVDPEGRWQGDDPPSPAPRDRDIVFAGGEFLQRPEAPVPASQRATGELRTIATAIESFAVDNDRYPGPTAGLRPIDVLASDLESDYIKRLPRVDPWGRPYLVWSDATSYVIVSAGPDGRLDLEYSDGAGVRTALGDPRPTNDESDDIVFVDGQFLRFPTVAEGELSPTNPNE